MTTTVDERRKRRDLDLVLIDHGDANAEYVLCPMDATDRELETMWIRAPTGDFVSLVERR